MGKAALVQAVDVPQSALRAPHMIATQDLQTGCRAGKSPKRNGAAATQEKAAQQQLEGAPEQDEQFPGPGKSASSRRRRVCAIFRCFRVCLACHALGASLRCKAAQADMARLQRWRA